MNVQSIIDVLQRSNWNNVDSDNDRLVQLIGVKALCDGAGHGRTAASCCLSLCFVIWRVCSSHSFLVSTYNINVKQRLKASFIGVQCITY